MSEHDGSGEIVEASEPRRFKPCERVIVGGKPAEILGSFMNGGEYVVHIEGEGIFRLPATAIRPVLAPAQLELDLDVSRRLRAVVSQLRDWQARLPALIRECEALEKAIAPR